MPVQIPSPFASAGLPCARRRVAVLCDYAEELWPSMDVVGDMLVESLNGDPSLNIRAVPIRPVMPLRLERLQARLRNADRLVARMLHYPRLLRPLRQQFDLFHVVDHSYSQLVHELPPERTVVTCHDLDTFRCLLEPEREPRTWPFRQMTARILAGLRKAAQVVCVSQTTRLALLRFDLVPPERVTVIYNGVHADFCPDPNAAADERVRAWLGHWNPQCVELLHVGATSPRKRIDVLLQVVAAVHRQFPRTRLLRVGGFLTPEQTSLARRLGILDAIVSFPFLERSTLAALYRRATLLLLPSEAEGFGLPIIEALACGTPVIASDIPAAREVGGSAVVYCPVGDIQSWKNAVREHVEAHRTCPPGTRPSGVQLAQAARFRWNLHASRLASLYHQVLTGAVTVP